MERVAFAMKLLPGAKAEYRRRHAAVWPEMLDALRAAGARNYSIYLHDDDLFGVLEVDDFERFRTMMDAAPVNAPGRRTCRPSSTPASTPPPDSTAASKKSSISTEPGGSHRCPGR